MMLNIATNGLEIWLLQDDCTIYSTKPRTDLVGNIMQARAYWVNRDTLAWLGAEPNDTNFTIRRTPVSPTSQRAEWRATASRFRSP